MDELSFIREQVRTERRHMGEVRRALAQVLREAPVTGTGRGTETGADRGATFIAAAASYLVFIVQRFNAQDQQHCELLRPRLPANDASALAAVDSLAATLARSREAVAALQQVVQGGAADQLRAAATAYLEFHERELLPKGSSLSPWMEKLYGAADWRRASMVDAESILEERARYDALRAALPPGIELTAADPASRHP